MGKQGSNTPDKSGSTGGRGSLPGMGPRSGSTPKLPTPKKFAPPMTTVHGDIVASKGFPSGAWNLTNTRTGERMSYFGYTKGQALKLFKSGK